MSHRKLETARDAFNSNLRSTVQLAVSAAKWHLLRKREGVPKFTTRHNELITELAFLRAHIALEAFLEESFILYLLGKKPPAGSAPRPYVVLPSRSKAVSFIIPEGRDYVNWNSASTIIKRAERFFKDGLPFKTALPLHRNLMDELNTIRNAIAHSSGSSREKFKSLVRNKLTIYPTGLSVGRFLSRPIPSSSPPESFLEHYLSNVQVLADRIVPP